MLATLGNALKISAQWSYCVRSVPTTNNTVTNSVATSLFGQEWMSYPAGRIDNVRNVLEEECSLTTVGFCVEQSVVMSQILSSGHVVSSLQHLAVGAVWSLALEALDIRHCAQYHHMQQAERGLVMGRLSLQWVLMNISNIQSFRTEYESKRGPLLRSIFSNRFTILTELISGLHSPALAGQLRRYSDWLQGGRSGDRIPVKARFFAHVQTGPGARPASCTMDTGSFPGVKRPGRDVDNPPPPSAAVENE
jgi:hypothetical protein